MSRMHFHHTISIISGANYYMIVLQNFREENRPAHPPFHIKDYLLYTRYLKK